MTELRINTKTTALAAACLAIGAVLGPSMTVSGDNESNVISACYSNHNGEVRIVTEDGQCRPDESAIEWNQAGPTGPAGPGLTGIELVSAASPFDSEDTKTFEAACPSNKMVLTGGARVASDFSFPPSAAAYLNWSAPVVIVDQTTPVSWVARAGEPTPTDRAWSVVVWVWCVDDPAATSA
jgi:hypothetical protein